MRSLRGRLTLGLTVVLAGVLLAAGVVVERDVDRSEREALDDRLRRTAELSRATALAAVQEEIPSPDDRLDAVLRATRSSLRLVLGGTSLLEAGQPPPSRPRLRPGLSTFEAGGARYRAHVSALRDPSLGGLARLEVITALSALEARRRSLRRTLALLGLVALVVGALGVWLAGGVVLRPLRRLRRATASIAGDRDLERRVADDRGPSEVRELAASFDEMLARLGRSAADRERALAATRRFAADAGHELRTPLTSIQATLSALARHPGLPADRRARMAADALEQQRRLVALLDGLQALARGDASPERSRVDLAEVVDAAVAAVRERHPGVRVGAHLPGGAVPVDAWEPGLRSLLDNLLENAARHGRPQGTVGVALSDGERPELVVEDDGPGIPDADRERIFEPFTRLAANGTEGSGLGLALVAQQARHHGADVEVTRSKRLGGARFVVRFPS
jgi:two-component system, OmpR family, sensor histidine kinase PrrB